MEITYNTKNKGDIKLLIEDYRITLKIQNNTFSSDYSFLEKLNKKLTDVNPILFDLLIWLLFYNLEDFTLNNIYKINKTNKAVVSYSGGADSTALLSLYGGIPLHITRSYNQEYESRQMRACDFVESHNIVTDFEKISVLYGRKGGFSVGIGYACLYFPLMELLDCDTIYFGVVFDDIAFTYAEPFEFKETITTSNFHKINNVINKYNIKIKFPIAGYSEVLTTKIADNCNIQNFSSCHTYGESDKCGKCFKCFRKQGIRGKKIDLTKKEDNNRIMSVLKKQPLKMASSTVWAIQNVKYKGKFYEKYYDVDVSWCERVNKYYNDEFGLGDTPKYDFQTTEDIISIKKFVNFVNNKNTYV